MVQKSHLIAQWLTGNNYHYIWLASSRDQKIVQYSFEISSNSKILFWKIPTRFDCIQYSELCFNKAVVSEQAQCVGAGGILTRSTYLHSAIVPSGRVPDRLHQRAGVGGVHVGRGHHHRDHAGQGHPRTQLPRREVLTGTYLLTAFDRICYYCNYVRQSAY